MKRWLLPPLRCLATVGLSALVTWLLFRKVDLNTVGHTFLHANLYYLIPIAVLFVIRYWLLAVRWSELVRHIRPVSVRHSFDRAVLAQAAGRLLPFQIGYLAIVQIVAVKFQIWRFQLFGTDLIERMLDGLLFALFLALAVATLSIGAAFTGLTAFMLFGTITGFALAWWATRYPDGAFLSKKWRLGRFIRRFVEGLSSIQNMRRAIYVFGLSAAIWCTEAMLYWVAALALGIHVNPLVFIFLVAVANIGAGIPFVQSTVGFVFLAQQALVVIGLSRGLSTAYALGLEALLVVPVVLCSAPAAYSLRIHPRDFFRRIEPVPAQID